MIDCCLLLAAFACLVSDVLKIKRHDVVLGTVFLPLHDDLATDF